MDPSDVQGSSDEVQILDEMPPRKTPKKRRSRKMKGPLDVSLLHRSKRLNAGMQGYMRKEDAAQVEEAPVGDQMEEISDIAPLTSIPPKPVEQESALVVYTGSAANVAHLPAPTLPACMVRAIGTDFLKMPPEE